MASRKIRDEVMMMTIAVNSDPAQQAIYELRKENVEYAKSIEDLQKKKDVLGRRTKANAEEFDKLTRQIKENQSAIENNKDRMEQMRRSLDITKMTMGQLTKEAQLLRRQLIEVVPNTPQAKELEARLAAVRSRMTEVNTGARQTSMSFQNLAERFNHYSGIVTAFVAVLIGFGVSVQQIIDRNNKMADAMSGVEKTTGMARQEVEELTRSFSDFDTRTKKIDLLKIAEVGGRLGVAKSEIADFVKEVDKANVALGDNWEGGAEKIAESLGKVTMLYKETKDLPIAKSINEVGSAVNELGAAGAASEKNVTEFATRVGALPEKLKPTIGEALALGASFEESGIDAERSGTAYANFISTAAKNVKGFALVMNEPVEKVKELINTDPTAFFLKFSEGLKGMSATDVATTLDYLKLNDQYIRSIIGSAAENTELFRQKIDLSNKSLKEATSLQEEFNKVNNNAAAIWEKTQKKVMELFTSAVVSKFIASSVDAFGKFIGAIEDADGYITGFRNSLLFLIKVMTLLMVTMVSYNLLTGVYNGLMRTAYERVIALTVVEKGRNAVMLLGNQLMTVYRGLLWLLAAGYSLLTGNVAGATFAMRGFTASLMANPIGLFITILITAVTAMSLFSKETDKAANATKNLNEVTKEGVKSAAQEVGKLDQLYKAATNAAKGKDAQRKAAEELQRLYPQIFGNIDKEIIMNGKARNSYLQLRESIIAASKAKAAQAQIDKINAEYLAKEEEIKQRMYDAAKRSRTATGSQVVNAGSTGAVVVTTSAAENREIAKQNFRRETENLKNLYIERNKTLDPYLKYTDVQNKKSLGLSSENPVVSTYNVPTGSDNKGGRNKNNTGSTNSAEDKHKREMEAMLRRGEQAVDLAKQIQLDIEDAKIEAMNEGFKKELAALDLQEKRKLEEIDKKKVAQWEIDAIDEKIAKAKEDDKKVFEGLKQTWIQNNDELEKLKIEQQNLFAIKRKALNAKHQNDELKDYEEDFQQKLKLLEREKNNELASYSSFEEMKQGLRKYYSADELKNITTWEEGKEALNKAYQKKELDMLSEHLEEMVKMYEGLDTSILTPEQKEIVLKNLEDVKNKLAEVAAKKQDIANGGNEKDKKLSKLGNKGNTDILGLTLEDWDQMFMNIKTGTDALGTMQAAVVMLQNAFGQYYEFVKAGEAAKMAEIDKNAKRQEKRYLDMLNRGRINQEQYEEEIRKLNEDTENKKAKLEYESAKRQRAIQIAQTIANTAQAIMSIWAQFPKFDFGATAAIMTGVVGAMGALQVATIARQPLPEAQGYEDGFGMEYDIRRQQDGKKFNVVRKPLRTGEVYRPTHFIAGENGVEMVIDSPTYTRFRPEVRKILHNEIAYARGYEGGYYPYLQNGGNSGGNEEMLITVVGNNTAAMSAILNKKFTAHIGKDMDNAKEIIDMTDEFNSYKNSAKKG